MLKPPSEAKEFRKLFAEAAEEALREAVGEDACHAIVYHVKSLFPGRENILAEPERLHEVLTEIFGEGAKSLETRILTHLQAFADIKTGRKFLLEFEPTSSYEQCMKEFVKGSLSDNEVILFTHRGSAVRSVLRRHKGVTFFTLTHNVSYPVQGEIEFGTLLPDDDTALLLSSIENSLKATTNRVCFIFDELSSLVLSIGFEKTFSFVRVALELLDDPLTTAIFLLNPQAHPTQVVASFRGLFNDLLAYDSKGLKVLKMTSISKIEG